MTGLFFRLAQQHINKRPSGISPVPSPVFPVLLNEHDVGVSDGYQEKVPQQQHIKPDVQTKVTDAVLHDNPGDPAPSPPAGDEPDVARQEKYPAVTPSLTPVSDSVSRVSSTNEHVTPLASATPMTPEAQSSIQPKPSSIQPKPPGDSFSAPMSSVFDDSREGNTSSVEESDLSPADNLVSKRVLNSHQVPPTSNRNVQSTQEFTRLEHEKNQTTINVSIGQIDVKATREDKPERKAPSRPTRIGSSALEEYHQKRVRGER
jgi:hypothetical protein